MRHELRLGDFEPVQPQADHDGQQDVASDVRVENRRLMREAKHRMAKLSGKSVKPQDEPQSDSVVPSLAQAAPSLSEDAIEENVRWPRPRLLALIVVITLAAVVPSITIRLMIWMVVMLLLTAVLLGPERARDAVYAAVHHLSRMWGREIGIVRRLLDRIPH
ncbi:hypothetical protein [Shimia sagamensis]|uniref:Uncharacterized protein n=1 Tax=Shimia sagamensis TaxID=1566352 RepID=A0ABY1NXA4_9RHOB|nr:hypothetical protein [Shimia sagamensis]SMP20469.1 hypothetical protein SAMN06265373_103526 [Shimia sagamensis]